MDTSKEYIKMCDCPEIQGITIRRNIKLEYGDNFLLRCSCGRLWIGDIHKLEEIDNIQEHHSVWLPRQDQLQEMVFSKYYPRLSAVSTHTCYPWIACIIDDFWKFVKKELDYAKYGLLPDNSWSMEQLWLAFVMQKLHQKNWDGEAWKGGGEKR